MNKNNRLNDLPSLKRTVGWKAFLTHWKCPLQTNHSPFTSLTKRSVNITQCQQIVKHILMQLSGRGFVTGPIRIPGTSTL